MQHPERTARARELRRKATDTERLLWRLLRNRQLAEWKWRRQEPIGPYFADFACRKARLVIELDGSQHGAPDGLEYDEERTSFMEANGWRVLRFANRRIQHDLDSVLHTILAALQPSPHPDLTTPQRPTTSPSPAAGEGRRQRPPDGHTAG